MSENTENSNQVPKGKNWEEVSNREEAETEMDEHVDPEKEPVVVEEEPEVLHEKLEAAKAEAHKHYDMMLRVQAEMENLKRRTKLDVEKAHKFGITKLVEDLVPVLDSLEQGLKADIDESHEALKQMHTGLQMTYDLLLKTAKKYGIEQVNPEGEKFNPEHHEAISMVEDPSKESNTVLSVFQTGYILHGRVLRPARVVVVK